MPDVKWYQGAGGALVVGRSKVTGGTAARLLRHDSGGLLRDALLGDDGTNTTLASGQLRLPDGTSSVPALVFADTDSGFYARAANLLSVTMQGVIEYEFGQTSGVGYFAANYDSRIVWASSTIGVGSIDTGLSRNAAGVVEVNNGTTGTLRDILSRSLLLGTANGQQVNFLTNTELTTINAAASTDTAIQIPTNAVLLAASVRVTTAIPTAATFTVTGTTSGTTFHVTSGGVPVAADTTDVGTAAGAYSNGAAQTVRITPNLQPGAATGRVRVTIHYYTVTPATS